MNYELKSVQPMSVFINALRIFVIVGFIVAILTFFILPNPTIHLGSWWQKILATLLFTGVYAVVVSIVLSLIAFLYNFWAANSKGVTLYLEKSE